MDTLHGDMLCINKDNKKKAYFAMCKVSVLLFVFSVLTYGVQMLFSLAELKFMPQMQGVFVHLLELFKVSSTKALATAKDFFASQSYMTFKSMIVMFLSLVMPAIIFAKSAKLTEKECFSIKGGFVKGFIVLFCFMQLVTVASSSFAGGIQNFLLPDGVKEQVDFVSGGVSLESDVFAIIMQIISVSVFVPVAEEFVFRGVIFSYLRRYGTVFAVVASGVVFGVAHSMPTQSVYAFVFGVFSAVLVVITGNIKTGIAFHSLNNLLTIFIQVFPQYFGEKTFNIVYSVILLVMVSLGFVGLYTFAKKDGIYDGFCKKVKEADEQQGVVLGIKEMLVLPLCIYCIFYALGFVMQVI